jgi:hypothetical protein
VFPHANNGPPFLFGELGLPSVALDILSELFSPELFSAFRPRVVSWAAVPEASVNEHRDSRTRKNDVRPPKNESLPKAVAEATGM